MDSPSHCYLAGRPCPRTTAMAPVALYMLRATASGGAEIYGCANDRQQASIVFDVAMDMVLQSPALLKRIKIVESTKRLVYLPTREHLSGAFQEVASKYGYNVHACIFDELLGQPNRELFDVMTQGSGAARKQPLNFVITTAGSDKNSICYEVHPRRWTSSKGASTTRRSTPWSIRPPDEADWTDPRMKTGKRPTPRWARPWIWCTTAPPQGAKENPAEEIQFRQFHLCQWTNSTVRWMPMDKWDACACLVRSRVPAREGRRAMRGWTCLEHHRPDRPCAGVSARPRMMKTAAGYRVAVFLAAGGTLALRVRRDHVPTTSGRKGLHPDHGGQRGALRLHRAVHLRAGRALQHPRDRPRPLECHHDGADPGGRRVYHDCPFGQGL